MKNIEGTKNVLIKIRGKNKEKRKKWKEKEKEWHRKSALRIYKEDRQGKKKKGIRKNKQIETTIETTIDE